MFLWPVFEYVKANRWAQITLLVLAAICTVGLYLAWRDNEVRKKDRAAQAVEQARQRAKMIERKTTIVQEERRNADQALAARNSGPAPATYSELSDTDHAIAEGRARSRFERS